MTDTTTERWRKAFRSNAGQCSVGVADDFAQNGLLTGVPVGVRHEPGTATGLDKIGDLPIRVGIDESVDLLDDGGIGRAQRDP